MMQDIVKIEAISQNHVVIVPDMQYNNQESSRAILTVHLTRNHMDKEYT